MWWKGYWLEVGVDWQDDRPIVFRKLDQEDTTLDERGYMSWEDALNDAWLLDDDIAFARIFPPHSAQVAICETYGHVQDDGDDYGLCALCSKDLRNNASEA